MRCKVRHASAPLLYGQGLLPYLPKQHQVCKTRTRFESGVILFLGLPVATLSFGIISAVGAPALRAGLTCQFAGARSAPIGFPMGPIDQSGAHGNEVKQVYRVFLGSAQGAGRIDTMFGGWVLSSLDGRFFYVPYKTGRTDSAGSRPIAVKIADPEHLPIAKATSTAFSPCFQKDWNGRDS